MADARHVVACKTRRFTQGTYKGEFVSEKHVVKDLAEVSMAGDPCTSGTCTEPRTLGSQTLFFSFCVQHDMCAAALPNAGRAGTAGRQSVHRHMHDCLPLVFHSPFLTCGREGISGLFLQGRFWSTSGRSSRSKESNHRSSTGSRLTAAPA